MDETEPPRDFEALRARIIATHPRLPKRLAQIAAFALEKPDEIALGTAARIAAKVGLQPSALIRFAQALGYEGFSGLQDVFRERLRDRVLNYEERLARLDRHAAAASSKESLLLEGFSEASRNSLDGLTSRVDAAELERAVGLLAAAETIYLVGFRRSFPVTSYMAYAFGKLGIRHQLLGTGAGLEPEIMALAGPRDAVLALSFTPYAAETIGLAETAHRGSCPLIAITDSPFSPLAKAAGVWFEVVEADFEGFRSLAASFALAATLTVATAERRRGAG